MKKLFLTTATGNSNTFFLNTILSAQARIRFEMGHHYIKRGIGGHHVLFCTISKHFCTETLKKKKKGTNSSLHEGTVYLL